LLWQIISPIFSYALLHNFFDDVCVFCTEFIFSRSTYKKSYTEIKREQVKIKLTDTAIKRKAYSYKNTAFSFFILPSWI